MAAALEKRFNGFQRIAVNHVEGAAAVGGAGVVAKVKIVVLRQKLLNLPENGQSAISGVEHADGALSGLE